MSHSETGPLVVTGGSRSIGAATVLSLARSGRPVVFSYASNLDAAEALIDHVQSAGGTALTVQAATRLMSTRRGGTGGAMVLMSSRATALGGGNEWIQYAASKGAVNSMTIGLAKELGGDGIRVNAVAAGLIDTEIHAAAGLADRLETKANEVPLGRAGRADEVAAAVSWLLSDAASYVSGAILDISAGR